MALCSWAWYSVMYDTYHCLLFQLSDGDIAVWKNDDVDAGTDYSTTVLWYYL